MIAPDIIEIVSGKLTRVHCVPGDDPILETRRKSLDLVFDGSFCPHQIRRAGKVRPSLSPLGSTQRVELALLTKKNKRALRM